jgi:Na+/H+ antiporter NhaC
MIRKVVLALTLFAAGSSTFAQDSAPARFQINVPSLALEGIAFEAEILAVDDFESVVTGYQGRPRIDGLMKKTSEGWESVNLPFEDGRLVIREAGFGESGEVELVISDGAVSSSIQVRVIPGLLSILPPLLAIALALIFRQVVVSLFAGIWLGATFILQYEVIPGFYFVLEHFVVDALVDRSHVQIILFSFLFGGMVGIITRNGGATGIANLITRYARTPKGGQVSAWLMSFFLFFDDYANVLVRGNLMRPITDSLKVSREKLAFLVDTGAATVASVFIISTWIGYEVGLIEQGLSMIGWSDSAYAVFVKTIPFRFYPIFALVLALVIALSGREFGPMLQAERRARFQGKVLRDGAEPATDVSEGSLASDGEVIPRWFNGLLPVVTILVVGLFGLYKTGTEALQAEGVSGYGLGEIVSSADSYVALLWASLSGCVVAMALSVGQRALSLSKTMEAWIQGMKSMFMAMIILVLAWALGAVTEELHTADFLVQILRGVLSPYWLPALTFIIAALVAFSTGTSWATMAIMMPLVIPLAHTLGTDMQLGPVQLENVLLGVISSVLAGAVFGDHCSPISDTTILSSMSSACDHIDHVRTQLPYALVAAFVGILIGDIPSAYGLSPWISILLGTAVLVGVVFIFGKRIDAVGKEA